MSPYFRNEYFYYFLILLAGIFLCFTNLGGHPIYILDEAKNAEAAREMFINNNWVVPTFNNELRTDKPPLHYWFMMISYKLFGVSAFSARFFSAVFGVLTIISTYHYTQKFFNRKLGLITTFVLCSSIFFMQEFHLAVPDPYLIFFVSFALFNFYEFYSRRNDFSLLGIIKRKSWWLFYVSIALGVLAKGPVAIALPGLVIVLFLIFKKDFNFKSISGFHPILGALLIFLISFPWYYQVHLETEGAFTRGFFLDHNLNRFSGEMEGHGGLPFVTWAFVLLGLLPFSFFIIQGFLHSWKKRKTHDFILFAFLVSAVFVVFFSISGTKLPNYPMPSYPFLSILISVYLYRVLEKTVSVKSYRFSLWVLFAISVLMPIGAYIALVYAEPQLYIHRWLSLLLLLLPLGTGLGLIYSYKSEIKKSIFSVGISSMFLTLALFTFIYPKLTAESPVSLAVKNLDIKQKAILYKGYDPAFLFNFEKTFPLAEDRETAMKFLNENPEAYIITKEKFFESEWNDVDSEILLRQKSLFENYTTVIFRLK